tara:strand:- start:93 stop:296 length:204 start_codon:yes stop_codon:yes gene_type:complete
MIVLPSLSTISSGTFTNLLTLTPLHHTDTNVNFINNLLHVDDLGGVRHIENIVASPQDSDYTNTPTS